jgi:prepilin-type N-terminal cleavage/methylation domain-containing protein
MNKYMEDRKEEGFTLIELLIAIVVVGILTAVAIVGIGGLTDNGKTAACQATADAAKAASAVFYANSTTNTFPVDFGELVGPPVVLDVPSGVTAAATVAGPFHTPPVTGDKVLKGKNWTLAMTGGNTTAPVFTCTIT